MLLLLRAQGRIKVDTRVAAISTLAVGMTVRVHAKESRDTAAMTVRHLATDKDYEQRPQVKDGFPGF